MTPDQQRHLDEIEKRRRRDEALILLLLLGFYSQVRRFTTQAVRHGFDPRDAADKVILGRDALALPGLTVKISNAMAATDLGAMATMIRQLPKPVVPPPSLSIPLKRVVAEAYRPFASGFRDEVRRNVRSLIDDVLARSAAADVPATVDIIATTMREVFEAKGYSPKNPFAARAQAVTLVAKAWSAGSFAGWRQPGIWEAIKGFTFVAVRDEHVCPICEPRNGLTLDRDDPYWLTNWPLLHWVCRCVVRPVFKRFVPSTIVAAPQPQPGFGMRPDLAVGYTFNATK